MQFIFFSLLCELLLKFVNYFTYLKISLFFIYNLRIYVSQHIAMPTFITHDKLHLGISLKILSLMQWMDSHGWRNCSTEDVSKKINRIITEGLGYAEVRNKHSKDCLIEFIGNPRNFFKTPPCLQTGFFALAYFLKKLVYFNYINK